MMKNLRNTTFRTALLVLFLISIAGCAGTPVQPTAQQQGLEKREQAEIDWTKEFAVTEQKGILEESRAEAESPVFKSLSPLESERVSLSFVQEDAAQVLQLLAHAVAMNLVLADDLGSRKVTAEYLDMSVREVLDSICRIMNVSWTEESGTIFIEQYAEKVLDLDFLGVVRKSSFNVGGDVLGSGQGSGGTGGSSPLSGNFQIEGEVSSNVSDIYTNLEQTVEKMLGSDGIFALNRQTGTLSLRATPKRLAGVENFINILRQKYRRQVLIEAKIIEVSLSEKHEMGIDWRTVGGLISNDAINATGAVIQVGNSVTQDDSFYTMNISSKYSDISGVFRALQEYGSLSVLSNPRLKAMNGQSALISVGQSVAYLRSFQQTTEGTGEDQTTESSTDIGSVFDGVLLGVTPVIEENNVIALHVVPIKSDLIDLDTVEFGSADEPYQITLPRVNLRELSTVTRVKSGDIVLLGGLIMEFDDKDNAGLPGLSRMPAFSWLFGVDKKESTKVELVVALQVHVVGPEAKI
jgi:MSHA type pilus biogenesis protein MshL